MNVVGKALEELYRIFGIINEDLFESVLPEPVITIQKTRGATLGHFTVDKVWRNKNNIKDNKISVDDTDDEAYYEMNIDPRWFCTRTVEEVVETMIHEMCHYYNKVNGIKDCSGNVHNKKFKSLAEKVGLVVEKGKSVGWGYTSLSPSLLEYIKTDVRPDAEAFEYFRAGIVKPIKLKTKKTVFVYTCPECGQTARGKKGISIKCGHCDIDMEMEDEDDSESNDNSSSNN